MRRITSRSTWLPVLCLALGAFPAQAQQAGVGLAFSESEVGVFQNAPPGGPPLGAIGATPTGSLGNPPPFGQARITGSPPPAQTVTGRARLEEQSVRSNGSLLTSSRPAPAATFQNPPASFGPALGSVPARPVFSSGSGFTARFGNAFPGDFDSGIGFSARFGDPFRGGLDSGAGLTIRFGDPFLFDFGSGFIGLAPPGAALDTRDRPRPTAFVTPPSVTARQSASAPRGVIAPDPTLSSLRAELLTHQLALLLNDPSYSFLTRELTTLLNQVLRAAPSAPHAAALAEEVARFTDGPEEQVALTTRHDRRQALIAANAQVRAEVAAFLADNPQVAARLGDLAARQRQRVQALAASPEAVRFQADWSARYQAALANTSEILAAGEQPDFGTQPGFAELMALGEEAIALMPELGRQPVLIRLDPRVTAVDTALAASRAQRIQQRVAEQSAARTDTSLQAASARAMERQAARLAADPTLAALRESRALADLAALQGRIHAAVAACIAAQGDACDPDRDPQVRALLPATNGDSAQVVAEAGRFLETLNQFIRSDAFQRQRAASAELARRLEGGDSLEVETGR